MTRTAGPEADLLRGVLDLLKLRGVHAFRVNSGTVKVGQRLIRLAPAGTSDVLGILKPLGRFLACEVKAPGGKLTEAQQTFLEAVRACGGVAVVIRDLKRLETVLDALAKWPDADLETEDP